MKRIIFIVLGVVLISLSACKKYLETLPDNIITVEDIFKSKENTVKYLGNIYNSLPNEMEQRFTGNGNSGPWIASTDEGKYTWDFNYSNNMNRSGWSNTDGTIAVYWNNYYRAIRNATDFINRIDGATNELSPADKRIYKGEARGLRAFYYYQLLRIYGPVVIIGTGLIPVDAATEEIRKPRSTVDECVDFITKQLDTAYNELPLVADFEGKMTKGIVKAYKVQTLQFAASPIFNGNTEYAALKNTDGKQLVSQTYDANKWAIAAQAAKDFITEFVPSNYRLYTVANPDPFKAAYLATKDIILVSWNSEWIFGRANSGTLMRYDRTPKHVGATLNGLFQGAGSHGATQAVVDAYFMANGKTITDPTSGYAATGFSNYQTPYDNVARSIYNQWTNREPRFYSGITFNNSRWLYPENGSEVLITRMEFSGNSGRAQSTSDVSPTGYIVRKNVAATDATRGCLYLRLAEIYLNYAEALNESNPSSPDILTYLNLIRVRAGIPQYGAGATPLPVPANQAEMRTAIRRERQVELAFESVRYFDTRRWKIAEQTDGGAFYGMNMTQNGNAFYTNTLLETRIFKKRDYLFPIPLSEVLKNNLMVKNPGW